MTRKIFMLVEPAAENSFEMTTIRNLGFLQSLAESAKIVYKASKQLTYKYWAFHLIYLAAGMFLMMTLTNWVSPSDNIAKTG